jgi:hypothetical protein
MQEVISRKIEYLEDEINDRILSFESKRSVNRNKAFAFKFVTAICSGAITILLGIHSADDAAKIILKDMALVLSASLTIFSTWDTFFNHRELWIKYTETSNELKQLRSDINYLKVGGVEKIAEGEIDELYRVYKKILNNTNINWTKTKSKNNTDKTKN